MLDSSLIEKIKGKHVLLDTCALSFVQNSIFEQHTEDLFNEIFQLHCPIVTNELIKIEFLRDSKSLSQARKKDSLIEALCEAAIPIRSEQNLFKEAVEISNIYQYRGVKGVELVDLLTSSFLKLYSSNLVLFTENHKDFPLLIHDRLGTVTLDKKQEISTFSFYSFNYKNFQECQKRFPVK